MILLKNYSRVLERCDENLKRESDESDDRLPTPFSDTFPIVNGTSWVK